MTLTKKENTLEQHLFLIPNLALAKCTQSYGIRRRREKKFQNLEQIVAVVEFSCERNNASKMLPLLAIRNRKPNCSIQFWHRNCGALNLLCPSVYMQNLIIAKIQNWWIMTVLCGLCGAIQRFSIIPSHSATFWIERAVKRFALFFVILFFTNPKQEFAFNWKLLLWFYWV